MRKWASALAVLACLAVAEPALADSPAEVYSDFVEDGALSCDHSRSALKGALNDASLYQYGDPLTFIQVKLAIRRQLAGGCRRRATASTDSTGETASDDSSSGSGSSGGSRSAKPKQKPPSSDQATPRAAEQNPNGSSEGTKQSGGMVLLGVGLLLLTLGSGGWAARRAFGDRP
jgi:hypothetical protein